MPNLKNRRLAEDIKREISYLMFTEIKDPRVNTGLVSIVRTELSGDNSHCKVYVSSLDGIESAKTAVKALQGAAWVFKKNVADKLHLRKCPELKFIADDSIEHSADIDRMLAGVLPKKTEETDED